MIFTNIILTYSKTTAPAKSVEVSEEYESYTLSFCFMIFIVLIFEY